MKGTSSRLTPMYYMWHDERYGSAGSGRLRRTCPRFSMNAPWEVSVVVTDRGHPVAKLVPPDRPHGKGMPDLGGVPPQDGSSTPRCRPPFRKSAPIAAPAARRAGSADRRRSTRTRTAGAPLSATRSALLKLYSPNQVTISSTPSSRDIDDVLVSDLAVTEVISAVARRLAKGAASARCGATPSDARPSRAWTRALPPRRADPGCPPPG